MVWSNDSRKDRWALVEIGLVSLLVLVIVGVILSNRPGQLRGEETLPVLPALNAGFNGTSAVLLTVGYLCIRRKRVRAHKVCMLTAFGTSCLFLVSYLIYHYQVGSRPFAGPGWLRVVYFPLLVSHIILAACIVPLALTTIYRAWQAQFAKHTRLARWTLPLWLYVSVTGVLVYGMLYWLPPQPVSPPVAVVQEAMPAQEEASPSPAVVDARELEASFLTRFPQYARREADQLALTLGSGEELWLQDVLAGSYDTDRVYSFHGYLDPIGYFLIHVLLWEGDRYLLIEAQSGAQHWLDAPPLLSPNGQRLLTASSDMMAGYNPNRVQIYTVVPGGIALEWSLEPEDWGPTEAEWLDDQTIRVVQSKLTQSFELYAAGTMLLKYAEGKWHAAAETHTLP